MLQVSEKCLYCACLICGFHHALGPQLEIRLPEDASFIWIASEVTLCYQQHTSNGLVLVGKAEVPLTSTVRMRPLSFSSQKITCPLQVNQKISKTAHIKELNAEIDRLKAELVATREKNGIYVPADQYEQREESSKVNAARLEMLEAEMEQQGAKSKEEAARLKARISDLQEVASAACCK